ncbi:MAG: RHS repeat protein, partial [Planctomycetes bacterium]|nr:RHS repeat protein [Planctomycetota bacterium]
MLAEFCYWNSSSGPATGPGTDDVNSNVDWGSPDDFLPRPYLGVLTGGNPAGAANLGVKNTTGGSTFPDQLHITDDDAIAIAWEFASDFEGLTQYAYEIEFDNDKDFSSITYNGSKTTSSSTDIGITPTIAAGTIYYLRVRVWNQEDRVGPWYYRTFRTNSVPGTVGNTNRTPVNTSSLTDWTPAFVWERPADADADPLHFQVRLAATISSNEIVYIVKSWTTSTATGTTPTSLDARAYFELSADDGNTWVPLPSDGAPAGDTLLVRLTMPDAWGLADTGVHEEWNWEVSAYDGFQTGTSSSTWTLEMGRTYTVSGQLQANDGSGVNSKTVRLYINGVDSGDTDTTAYDSVNGRFDIVTTDALEVGDVLWIYVDGETEKGAAVFHFTGDDIAYSGAGGDIIVRDQCAYIYDTIEGLPYTNEDFEITTADTDIPWTYSSGTVTFKASLDTDVDINGEGVYLFGRWDMSEDVDGTTSLDTWLHIWLNGRLRTQGFDASFDSVENKAWLEILDGSTFTIDGADSTTSGTMIVEASTFKFAGSSALTLTVDMGTLESRNGATFNDLTANVSSLVVDSTSSTYPAVLSCADTTFDEVKVTIEDDGVLGLFNDNVFQNDVSTQHIYWKSESSLSATQMRGVQFNTSVDGSTTFNVTSSSTANNINMIACGGVGQGEAYDSDSSNLVDWELAPPTGLTLTLGDTRIRADWDDSDQVDASAYGFNLYIAPLEDSTWTATPSYAGGYTTFTDGSASFSNSLVGKTFYPDADSTTSLTVYDVPSTTTIRVSGDYSTAAASGDTYSFFVKVNVGLLTDTHDEAESLSNSAIYYFYVTIDDTTEDAPALRNRGEMRSLAPAASSISAIAPDNAESDSVLALSVVGEDTHWEGSTTVTITKGGGSGVTVNDTLVISAKLALVDATLSSATTGTWTVTATENDIWGIAAYDEVETASLTVNSNAADLADRPTLVFSTNNSGIDEDDDTSGSFVFNIDFTDNGGGVDTSNLEVYASRDVTISSSNKTAGTELIGAGLSIDTLNDSRATCTINQTAGTELFADGEYTLTARVADDNGNYSEWATRTFYVEGAATDVAKTATLLYQGDTEVSVVISGTFSTTVDGIDFGTGITTVSYNKDSSSQVTAVVTVDETAACGPRTLTVDMTTGTDPVGVVNVEYPTNILPTVNNDEPSRNPAIGGVNVFLINGEFFKSETDLAVRGRMMGISWSRFYRSQISYDGPLGHGWVGHYFQRAVIDGSSDINWYTPDGRKEVFPDVTGGYSNPTGVYVTATSESTFNTITLTDRHGYQCVFNADGRLWRCIDRNGNATECSYNYAGQLTAITNDLGETFSIKYGSDGRVSDVDDNMWNDGTSGHSAARSVEYTYDSDGNLVEQAAPETARYLDSSSNRTTYAYRYDDLHRMIACVNPREFNDSSEPVAYLENFYDSSDRVIDQKLGDEADVLDTHITKSAFIRLRYESSTLIHEIDRNGHRTDYTIDGTGRATTVKRYTGFYSVDTDEPITHSTVNTELSKLRSGDPTSFDTVFTYNSNHEILTITYPRGNKVTYDYPSGSSQTSGTCTSNPSATVLTDSGKSWTADAYIGMTLRVGSNASEYAYYPIVDNDATTITIESTGFSLSGDGWLSGEDYSVYDEGADPMSAGNVLTVTRSDEGLGSLSDIVTTYTYEPRYQFVKTVTDPRSNTTIYTYDYEESAGNGADAGNLVLVTSPTVTGSMASSGTIETRTTYNEYGQPVTMTDGEGNVTYLKYYSSGSHNGFLYQRISAWGELDLTSEFEYDPVGNLTASWAPRAFESGATKDDYKTSYEVNELNQTWHVTAKYELGYPGGGSLESVDSYRYFDANGNLIQSFREYITDAGTSPTAPTDEDDPTTFGKSSSAMAATWVETSTTYNLLNYATSRTVDAIAGSAITQYTSRTEYDSNYNVIASISPLGNRSHTVYDERDMVYQRIAGAESDVEGTYQTDYDANGNVSSSFDALGNETTYTYDGFDRTTQVTDAAGHYRTSAYDANSNVTTSSAYDVFDTLLAQSTTTYDEINRGYTSARFAQDHNGNPIGDGYNTSTTVFDKNSRVVSSTNDNGVTYTSYYDAANRTTETRDAVGNRTLYTYNANGATEQVDYIEINGLTGATEPSHVEYILNRSDVAWEVRDRRWSSDFDTSGYTKRDGWGRVTSSVNAAGNSITTNYDLLSRVTDSTEEAGTDDINTMFEYDDDSRTITRAIKRNPADTTYQETEYVYDERSRLITLRRPDGDIWNYQYDANSNRIGWDDPLGTAVTDTYDARNLIAYRNIERGTGIVGTDYESYEFDGLGRLTSCSNYADGELITASAWEYNTQSQPEQFHQTVADKDGAPLGTWTSGAEYDATGFNTATIYSDGHRVEHSKDQLDRVSSSYDVDQDFYVAAYVYAGPHRLIERTAGNGVRTTYEWEASGCGCGGSTPFCESVQHTRVSSGEILFGTDRRYDELGLVTVEREDHFGTMGSVYRYDEAKRLDTSYFGVDLYSTALSTYADQSNTPTSFGLKRAYSLDPRGNRSGSSAVADSDDSSGGVYDYAYTANDDTNQYTAVDGDTYTFDAIEQTTYDPSTGLYHAYDYKGQLISTDEDSALTSPEVSYGYDNQGKRRLMADADDTNGDHTNTVYLSTCACNCGCTGNEDGVGELISHEADTNAVLDHQFNVWGPEVESPGSSSAMHPATAAAPANGRGSGNAIIATFGDSDENGEYWLIFAHNQHGSTSGCTDRWGAISEVFTYTDYGQTMRYKPVFDCPDAYVSSVANDTPSAGQTTITVGTVLLGPDSYNGLELRVVRPEAASNRLLYGEVLDTTMTTIVVQDDGSDSIYNALNGVTQGFQVLDLPAANASPISTSGTWDFGAGYDSMNDVTAYTDFGAFGPQYVGMQLFPETDSYPNVSFTIVDVPDANTVLVAGDTTSYGASPSDPYTIAERCWRYDSGNDESDYFDADATFASYMVGWTLVPDILEPCYLSVIAVDAENKSVTVKGDASGLATPLTDRYHLIPPPGVARSTGALCKPEDAGESSYGGTASYDDPGTVWLWSGYRYVAPQVGHDVTGTTFGAQSGV